jgi:hypothetical protein
MHMALEGVPTNYGGKGLSIAAGWPEGAAPSAPARVLGVLYRRKARDGGMLLNYCPWCGAEIGRRAGGEDTASAEGRKRVR